MTKKTGRLLIGRKQGQRVRIRMGGEDVWVRLVRTKGQEATLEFEAPVDINIAREEILDG